MNTITITNKSGLIISQIGSTGGLGPRHPLVFDPILKKVTYNSAKTFVIDHPEEDDKFLVHACLEGPEAGVYYRGKACIKNNKYVSVALPSYVSKFATNFTLHVTPIYDEYSNDEQIVLKTSEVINNKFTVHGSNCNFFWIVYGERGAIEVEPLKSSSEINGEGPYKWVKH